ncbi:MAG: ATP-binding protein [Chitinophagales bacterium]|nr:ATP-binding protein [Chitinophagales bacterium]
MRAPICFHLLLLLLVFSGLAFSQETEVAFPYLKNYTDKVYNASPRNYGIAQDNKGVLYFANQSGVLKFDGNKWSLLKLPENMPARSVAVDKNGKIYVGSDDEFGYFDLDSAGALSYSSLSKRLKAEDRPGSIGHTFSTEKGVYYISLSRIFLYDGKLKEVPIKNTLVRQPAFQAGAAIFINEEGIGLQQLEGEQLVKLTGTEAILDEPIQFICPLGDQLLIGTRYKGLFTYKNGQLEAFKTNGSGYIIDHILSTGVEVDENRIAVGTLQGGVVLISKNGFVKGIYNKLTGLNDLSATSLFVDQQKGLWIATNNGISRVAAESPVSFFGETAGLMGNVTNISRSGGKLYVTTNLGVYYLLNPAESGASDYHSLFKEVAGFHTEIHDMLEINGSLLLATADGLYEMEGNVPQKVLSDNSFQLYQIPGQSFLLVTLKDSIVLLEKQKGKWQPFGMGAKVKGDINSVVAIGEHVWLGTDYNGIISLKLDLNSKKIAGASYYSAQDGLPDNKRVKVFLLGATPVFSTSNGLYMFNTKDSRFYLTDILGKDFTDKYGKLISVELMDEKRLFVITEQAKGVAVPSDKNGYRFDTRFYSRMADPSYQVAFVQNGNIYLGGSKGIIKVEEKRVNDQDKDFNALLTNVHTADGTILFSGTGNKKPHKLSSRQNALVFEFASPNFDPNDATEFQYKLEGFDNEWSKWSTDTRKEYTNLPAGHFTFKVRAKNLNDFVSKEDAFSFHITPPWYKTWWAYLLLVILIGLVVYGIIVMRSAQLKREQKRLQALVDERTKELKDSQERMVEQQKLASLGQLTAGIAHEIKNPLNFVNNFAELSVELLDELVEEIDKSKDRLGEKDADNMDAIAQDLKQNMQKINEHGKRADNIVKNMLMHSRNQRGDKEAVDINTLVKENVTLAYRGLRGKHSQINVQFPEQFDSAAGTVNIVKQDVSQVLLNIVNNAIYAAFKKKEKMGGSFEPTVSISTKALPDNRVEIKIKDNGTGIPKGNLDKIFNPFFTTKPTGEGTGLGLSISHDIIVKGHNGDLRVDSKEGEFTEFTIVLNRQ